MTTKEAARLLGISPATLETWRCRNHPHQPSYFVINGRIVYDEAEVLRWRETCRVTRRS